MDLPMDSESRQAIRSRLDTIRRRKKSIGESSDPEILSITHDVEWMIDIIEELIENNS